MMGNLVGIVNVGSHISFSPIQDKCILFWTVYYSGLADMAIEDVICYACGAELSTECMGKYIEEKSIHSQVFPTCGMERCKKFNTKLFMHKRARKIDKKWKDEQRMKKRLRAMKLREEAVQNSDGMELDVDE